jgi:Tol biopolymer transport system component
MVLTGGTGSDPFGMGAGAQIYVMNLDGTASRQITDSGAQQNFLPHFSPDGTRLVFTRFMTGSYTEGAAMTQAWDTDVWSYSFATHTETNLTSTPGIEESYPVWSPDGSQIAYIRATEAGPSAVHIMNADGSGDQFVVQGSASWQCCRDIAWSSDNWLISVIHDDSNPACVRSRIDKFRPDGSQITQVSDGGPNCSVATYETAGDADPGFSADGKTIYSSRGFPKSPPGAPAGMPPLTERKLYAFSSEAWYSGKPEQDLSFPSEPDCIEGVPRGSPDGTRVLLFRACFDKPNPKLGAYWASADGKSRTFVATGFAPDWNRAQ